MISGLLRKIRTKKKTFDVGQQLYYRGSMMLVIDKRESDILGCEYLVFLEGQVHGWITHSVLKECTEVKDERNSK